MKAFIPENLHLEKYLREHKPAFKYNIDNFYYIIGLFYSIPASNKELLCNPTRYIPINAQLLQRKIHDYKYYLGYLKIHNIIECDEHYIKGEKSKWYRFSPLYNTISKEVEIGKLSLIKHSKNEKKSYKLHMRKQPKLSKHLERLSIDFEAAFDYITEVLKLNESVGIENALLKFECALFNIRRIRDKDYFFLIDNKDYFFLIDNNVGRLHTNLTILKSEVRNFITCEGQNLVNVDICNSQPFLSACLFNSKFYTTATTTTKLLKVDKLINSNILDNICRETLISYIMLVDTKQSHTGKGFQRFIEEVVKGTFYDLMAVEYKKETGIQIVSRKELKSMMFIVLFTDNRYWGQKDALAKRIFERLFPEVYQVFATIKHGQKNRLPCILQAIESHIMLNVVVKRIGVERPDMPIFTIHDSITCPVGCEDYVKSVIEEEMQNLIGYTPQLKYEYWEPDNAYKTLNIKPRKLKNAKAA